MILLLFSATFGKVSSMLSGATFIVRVNHCALWLWLLAKVFYVDGIYIFAMESLVSRMSLV